jgi:hypothetical protein
MIFHNKKLTHLLCGALAVVLTFLVLNIFLIYPKFEAFLIESIEDSAIRAARHIESQLKHTGRWSALLDGGPLGPAEKQYFAGMRQEFGLRKVKIFSEKGMVVHSTDPADIGTLNEYDYFHNQVSRGRVFSKVVEKESRSLEDQTYRDDVVEVYVPAMEEGRFVGAFELYYTITAQTAALDRLTLFSLLLPLSISGLLLIALYWGFRNLDQSLLAQAEAEKEIGILRGIIPICMYCKEIRDDAGYWNQLESYIESHSEAQFSHGICNDCLETHYGKDIADQVNGKDSAA